MGHRPLLSWTFALPNRRQCSHISVRRDCGATNIRGRSRAGRTYLEAIELHDTSKVPEL